MLSGSSLSERSSLLPVGRCGQCDVHQVAGVSDAGIRNVSSSAPLNRTIRRGARGSDDEDERVVDGRGAGDVERGRAADGG